MKNRLILFSVLFFTCLPLVFSQSNSLKFSILGDSYSTFKGYLTPDSNYCWYGIENHKEINDVREVEEMWWYPLIKEHGYQLELNNSFSGATVCYTGYNGEDYSDRSFITRMDNLGTSDVIFIFGGTNDNWAGAPLGEFQYSDWTKEDLYSFRPAYCCLLSSMKARYPDVKIFNITNTELREEVTGSIEEICSHYGITNIQLENIDKQSGHPSVNGMKQIYQQVWEVVAGE